NPLLDTWDLVIAHDFFDDMKRVPWLDSQRMFSLRRPYSPYLRRLLYEAAGRHLSRYTELAERVWGQTIRPKIVRRGVYVCPAGLRRGADDTAQLLSVRRGLTRPPAARRPRSQLRPRLARWLRKSRPWPQGRTTRSPITRPCATSTRRPSRRRSSTGPAARAS